MPEGHTIHNIAIRHRRLFVGGRVRVASPQGRFAEGAAILDDNVLDRVEAHGKHLLYFWKGAPPLHVHLGLIGKFRTYSRKAPAPPPSTRLLMQRGPAEAHLIGPMVCELSDPETTDELVSALGPDPLQGRDGAAEFADGLKRRTVAIGAALLDQRLVAGVGNVYRSEILFLEGLNPKTPAKRLKPESATSLWDQTVAQLERGLEHDRIITVTPEDAEQGSDERVYVYKRSGEPCLRCGSTIRSEKFGQRLVWWCPTCQRRRT